MATQNNNFISEVYSDLLLMDRDRESVFISLADTEYTEKGTAKDIMSFGDRVHFTAVPKPTVRAYAYTTLTAQTINDADVELEIDQVNYFNVTFNDIKTRQALKSKIPEMMKEGRKELVKTADAYLGQYTLAECYTTVTNTAVNSANIISVVSSAATYLYKNDVPYDAELTLAISPDILEKIQTADILFNTNNSETISRGVAGWVGMMKKFLNMRVRVSNNVYVSGGVSYCRLMTNKAFAFAEQIAPGSVEKLRDTGDVNDIIRGVHLYGAKVIKPKEIVTLALTPVAETVI
jgi:hypothetical protein